MATTQLACFCGFMTGLFSLHPLEKYTEPGRNPLLDQKGLLSDVAKGGHIVQAQLGTVNMNMCEPSTD